MERNIPPDEIISERPTAAERRAFREKENPRGRVDNSPAARRARERSRKWRDDRHDLGLPDNRLLATAALQLLLHLDTEKRARSGKGIDDIFNELVDRLPRRFDKDASRKLIESYREKAWAEHSAKKHTQ